VVVSVSNFNPGTYTVQLDDNSGDGSGFPPFTINVGANRSGTAAPSGYLFGYPGRQIWAFVDGVRSPDYTW
jgi:hypothetical protein